MNESKRRLATRGLWPAVAALVVAALSRPHAIVEAQQPVPRWDATQPQGRTRQIDFTTTEGTWMSVDISPDGRWIVFDLLAHVYRVAVAGGEAECLTQGSGIALNYHPRFSPDGTEIVFISDRSGQDNVWVMNADGTNPRALVTDYRAHFLEPLWAPDGQSVIVRRQEAELVGYEVRTSIWRYPRDGSPGTQLVGSNELLSFPYYARGPSSPSISRDGRSLYYQIFTGSGARKSASIDVLAGAFQIIRVDLLTKEVEPVAVQGFAPEISPDGRWLAFAQRIPDGVVSYKGHLLTPRTALWVRDLETGAERVVMDPIEIDAAEDGLKTYLVLPKYAWSADGKSIVLAQGGKLRRVRLETGDVETISFSARVRRTISEMAKGNIRLTDEPFEARFLRWPVASPDGKTLAFQAVGKIWLMDLPNGEPRRLTPPSLEGFEYAPAWSPDGRSVAFTTVDRNAEGHVWKMAAGGGAPARLSVAPGRYLYPVWSPDGRTLVVVRQADARYDLLQMPAAGGQLSPLARVKPTLFEARGGVAGVRPSFGPEGRLFYPETDRSKDGRSVTVLRSVRPDGGNRRDHLAFAYATEVVPSPDGKWAAYSENENVFLIPLGGEPNPAVVELADRRATRLTRTGGLFPRWRGAATLEFGAANRYFVHHADRGTTDSVRIRLMVPRPVPAGTVALTNARIITLDDSRRVIQKGTVVVTGSRITCVGSCDASRADRSIDLSGKTIIPGLVDTHMHFGKPNAAFIRPQSWEIARFLAYGVTTAREPADWPEHNMPLAELIDAGLVTGSRYFTVGGMMAPESFGSNRGDVATGRALFHDVPDLAAAQNEVGRIINWAGPGVALKTYYQGARDRRQWLVHAARERGITATSENDDLYYTLAHVMDGHAGFEHSIRNLPLLADAATFLGQAKIVYSSTLSAGTGSQRQKDYWLQELDLWKDPKARLWQPPFFIPEQRRRVKRPVTDFRYPLYAQGVADVIARGGYATIGSHGEINGPGPHVEVWMNASAMSPMEALAVATRHGAYFLGADQDIGSIEVGKLADILVLNQNPLDDIRNTLDMAYVMQGGRLYDDDTLNEIWPRQRPYGPRPWANEAALRMDERSTDYHDYKPRHP